MLNAMTLETSSDWDQPAIDTKFIQRALRPVRSRSFHSNSDYPICLPNNPLKQTWYTGMLFPVKIGVSKQYLSKVCSHLSAIPVIAAGGQSLRKH